MNQKSTACVHAGSKPTKGVNTPIYPSSAFQYDENAQNIYPRYFNTPNQLALCDKIKQLEKGEDALLLSSGMAAVSSIFTAFLEYGDHVLVQEDIYGGTAHFVNTQLEKWGISYSFFDIEDAQNLTNHIQKNTKLIYLETPSNPLLKTIDLEKVSDLARKKGIITVIDNTFATPILQNPIAWGIDIILHSGTKYLGGHSDVICGAVVSNKENIERIKQAAISLGGCINAQTCHLIERSIKTLALRIEKQSSNALALAEYLSTSSYVDKIYYPHKDKVAQKQMSGFGAMLSFDFKGDALGLSSSFEMVQHTLSLGGIETTVCLPAKTSHALLSDAARAKKGISDKLIRVSVGIEHVSDIIADFETSMKRMS